MSFWIFVTLLLAHTVLLHLWCRLTDWCDSPCDSPGRKRMMTAVMMQGSRGGGGSRKRKWRRGSMNDIIVVVSFSFFVTIISLNKMHFLFHWFWWRLLVFTLGRRGWGKECRFPPSPPLSTSSHFHSLEFPKSPDPLLWQTSKSSLLGTTRHKFTFWKEKKSLFFFVSTLLASFWELELRLPPPPSSSLQSTVLFFFLLPKCGKCEVG